ncbi:MAG TPA: hypothetical protein VJY41_03125, partial [Prolixibacteraceae bacterium]|nr:hypothetical protein [Prolixibacteraceae bacterium]
EQEQLKKSEQQKKEQIISFYKQKADSINQDSYVTSKFLDKYSVFKSSNEDARIVGVDGYSLLNEGEFGFFDISSIKEGQLYSTVIGIDSAIINPPVMKDLLGKLRFKPASFTFDYEDYTNADRDHRWCQSGNCVTLNVNAELPIQFCQKYAYDKPEIGQEVIILKLKKSKEGIEVLNSFYSDSLLWNEIRPELNLDLELAKNSKQIWYLYYVRDYSYWSIFFGGREHYYKDDDLVKFKSKEKDWKKVVLFTPSTMEPNCP